MSTKQPIPLIYSGQGGDYFGTAYEKLPENVDSSIIEIGQLLANQGMVYVGKLICSQFHQIETYAYVSPENNFAISVIAQESNFGGIDCVSRFTDNSYLTTTTVKVIQNAYEEQGLFRVSLPGLNVNELISQHLDYVKDFEKRCGEVLAMFNDLLAIAQMVDEYTIRQQSNFGHGLLQFTSGLASVGMAQMMENDVDEEDDEEEYNEDNEDKFEYDEDTVSPLVRAILQDDLAQVETLLANGAEVNPSSWNEKLPLVAAVYKANSEIIEKLIAAGANLDKLDFSVDSRPLGMAIEQNDLQRVRLLLDAGASPEGGDLSYTGLTLAIEKNNLEIVKMLLEAGADPNTDMEDCDRAIMHAAWCGNLEIIKTLVAHGADVNAWSEGDTAIISAARNAHREVYDYLYPLVDAETKRYADKHGQYEIAKAIKRKSRENNKVVEKLGDAAMYGKLAKVEQLIAEGAEANAITECGKSPLMLAAMYGHKSVMEALLDAGADPNLGSDEEFEEGTTALMYIASSFFASNRAEVIKFLVNRGANPNARNDNGGTAIIVACNNADSVKALIEAGADVNIRDEEGNTAMMISDWSVQQLLRQAGASEEGLNDVALVEAASEGDLDKVKELLQAGANINYSDGSALVEAAGNGHLEIVNYLIETGADVNSGWKTGCTPIADAAYSGYLAVVERLLAAGANPFQRTHDDEFDDALDYARRGQAEGHHKDRDYAAIIELLSRQQR